MSVATPCFFWLRAPIFFPPFLRAGKARSEEEFKDPEVPNGEEQGAQLEGARSEIRPPTGPFITD